jgi:predicted Zn finger-like uncharacterized protein
MSHPTEKRGNTHWVQCPNCKQWFHVSAGLLAREAVKLHCPACQNLFPREAAARVAKAG